MPDSISFVSDFNKAAEWKGDESKYYITYHNKHGFGFEKKDMNLWLLGRVLSIFVRIFKRLRGYDYNFANTAKKLQDHIAIDLTNATDKPSYLKGCAKLQYVVQKVLASKSLDLLDTKNLDQETKNQLLVVHGELFAVDEMKKLIVQGADPNFIANMLFSRLDEFMDVLTGYVIERSDDNSLHFTKPTTGVQFSLFNTKLSKNVWEHNSKTILSYVEGIDKQSEDLSYAFSLLKMLRQDANRDQLIAELILVEAEKQNCTTLDIALKQNLTFMVKLLIEQGADMASLSQTGKNCLLGFYLDEENYVMAESTIIDGADVSAVKGKLKPFMAYAVDDGNIDLALKIKRAGVSEDPESSLILWAAKNRRLDIVQECHRAGDSLRHKYAGGNTLLHVAAHRKNLELYDWLVTRVDVREPNDVDRCAYYSVSYERKIYNSIELAFVTSNSRLYDLLADLSEADAFEEVANLRAKYPATPVDHILYEVNDAHYRNQIQIAFPKKKAPGFAVDDLLTHFDKLYPLNEHYERRYLVVLLGKIKNRTPYVGTPQYGVNLERFYHAIECAVTHTFKMISEIQDQKKKDDANKSMVDDFVSAAKACGGIWYAMAARHYIAQIRGRAATFQEEILDELARFRATTFETLGDSDNVHDFNAIIHALGREFGLPGMNMVEQFDDPIGADVDEDQKEYYRKEFNKRYSSEMILYDQILQLLEDNGDLREKYFDWAKANIPSSWQKEKFDKIRQDVAQIATRKEQIAYLQNECDIFAAPNQSIEDAIADERKTNYFEQEVVVDQYAKKMRLQPKTIAKMLEQFGVLTKTYDLPPEENDDEVNWW